MWRRRVMTHGGRALFVDEIASRCQAQEKRVRSAAPDEAQLQQLEAAVDGFKAEYEEAKQRADAVEDQVHRSVTSVVT